MTTVEAIKHLFLDTGASWVLWLLGLLSIVSVAIAFERMLLYPPAGTDLAVLASELVARGSAGRAVNADVPVPQTCSLVDAVFGQTLCRSRGSVRFVPWLSALVLHAALLALALQSEPSLETWSARVAAAVGFRDPVLAVRRKQELGARYASALRGCVGRRLPTGALECVAAARTTEQLSHDCLR